MLTIVTLPIDMVANVSAYIGDLFTDLTPLIVLCIGLPLGFWAVGKIIALVRSGFRTRAGRA